MPKRRTYFFCLLCLLCTCVLHAQQDRSMPGTNQDSAWVAAIKNPFHFFPTIKKDLSDTLPARNKDSVKEVKRSMLAFQQGYVQYNLNYRSRIDTPYAENNIYQHGVQVNADFLIKGSLPVTVNYLERQSNSALFRDFRDIRVDVNGPQLQRMRADRLRENVMGHLNKLSDQASLPDIHQKQLRLGKLNELLRQPELVSLFIQAKERLAHLEEIDTQSKWKDSIQQYGSAFVALYEEKEKQVEQLEQQLDSLKTTYRQIAQKLQTLRQLLNKQINTGEGVEALRRSLEKAGIKKEELPSFSGLAYSLRKLSLGRTMPDFSPLTVQHINVKGINAELSNDRWYVAFTAGAVDYRLRDFVYGNEKQPPQFIYAARMGLGRKNGTHIYASGYKGKKQLYAFNAPSREIVGAGIELQYVLARNHRITAEVVQSSPGENSKLTWNNDDTRAYNLQWTSWFQKLNANLEANYQKAGVGFQSFNSYRVNAATESWLIRYDQYFFGRQLRINAAIRKNEYANPLIIQRYATNTVFKTIQASFRRKRWPGFSAGYIPSSQYTLIDNRVYESRYQTFTASGYHTYKVGVAQFSTNAFYTRFYNQGSDSGFVYYNARQVSVFQQMQFPLHIATVAATISKSSQFTLITMQAGTTATIWKKWQIEGGVKINHLNSIVTKTGLYLRTSINLPWLGQLSGSYDDAYLPGLGHTLMRNQQMNLGFTRRIK